MSRTKEWLMTQEQRDLDLLSAEIEHLEAVNAALLAACESVVADIKDPDGEAWLTPTVVRQLRAAIARAKGGTI